MNLEYDLIIIGAGPGGYVAAIRAGQLGLKTALIEKKHIGGMCLNWGCIPSKSFIESAKMFVKIKEASKFGIDGIDKKEISFNWTKAAARTSRIVKKLTGGVSHLLKKNNVEVIEGKANLISPNKVSVNNRTLETANIIIATGSFMPPIELEISSEKIIGINKLFELESLPQNIIVYGSGPVVAETAQLLSMIGKKVSIILSDQLLPGFDLFLQDFIMKKFKSEKTEIFAQNEIEINNNKLFANGKEIEYEVIINAGWRKAILPDLDFEIALTDTGYISVNSNMQTSISNIYAIGDVTGNSFLAHPASAQGLHAVNHIKGITNTDNLELIPLNLYANPEIAQIGKTEQELIKSNTTYKISTFPLSANGKALIENSITGFIRVLFEEKYGEVLGVQIVAPAATDLISEAAVYLNMEATVYDIANTIHAHPTISEIFMETGFDATGKPIHK